MNNMHKWTQDPAHTGHVRTGYNREHVWVCEYCGHWGHWIKSIPDPNFLVMVLIGSQGFTLLSCDEYVVHKLLNE